MKRLLKTKMILFGALVLSTFFSTANAGGYCTTGLVPATGATSFSNAVISSVRHKNGGYAQYLSSNSTCALDIEVGMSSVTTGAGVGVCSMVTFSISGPSSGLMTLEDCRSRQASIMKMLMTSMLLGKKISGTFLNGSNVEIDSTSIAIGN